MTGSRGGREKERARNPDGSEGEGDRNELNGGDPRETGNAQREKERKKRVIRVEGGEAGLRQRMGPEPGGAKEV